jgi:hypothetical protein
MEQDKHDHLADLVRSYAAIIGIIDPSDIDIADEDIAATRKRWAHLNKSKEGLPVFDDSEATGYTAEVSGTSLDECLKVLVEVCEP